MPPLNLLDGGLRTFLLGDSAVKALVGDRIHRLRLPEPAKYPAAVINLISTVPDHDFDGDAGLDRHRIQIDCYADTLDAAAGLGRTLRARLDSFTGMAGSSPVPCAHLLTVQELYDQEVKKYRVLTDWHVWESLSPA